MVINHNKKTDPSDSPYDDIINPLDNTYIPSGQSKNNKITMQEKKDNNAAQYSNANAVNRTITKGSNFYKNRTLDLEDAEQQKSFSYDELIEDAPPRELKAKTKPELKVYVNKQSIERNQIQSEITNYSKKRQEFISLAKTETSTDLESAVIVTIKKQAQNNDYSWT
jgi:phosphoribosyl-AMP cyclohydrolase